MKKLYRSDRQKVFAGVCGGLAEYFDVDVSIIRLIWLLLFLFWGTGLLAYIVAALVIPRNPYPFEPVEEGGGMMARNNAVILIGIVLILLGALALFNVIVPGFLKKFFFPGLLILSGLLIIVSSIRDRR
ncbi:MAG TPA: PspC domain-containing protein [Candidatus Atribacteria bacterium]|nr:PspC domain-containing protein [Candidatus Atribacteria bacterium]HPT79096.1 PspC domain-containing protein [Candidatus Atribacteria bacterium]